MPKPTTDRSAELTAIADTLAQQLAALDRLNAPYNESITDAVLSLTTAITAVRRQAWKDMGGTIHFGDR